MKKTFWVLVSLMLLAVLFGKSEAFAPVVGALDGADKQLMLLLNHNGGLAADVFWKAMSSNVAWAILGSMFLFGLRDRGAREYLPVILCLALTIAIADQVSSSFFKPYFSRIRPSHCDAISGLLHYVGDYRGGRHGFVSSHAANAFGISTYISLLLKNKKVTHLMLAWACCVSYSRIYLGVHYPGDVLGGAILGVSVGILCHHILIYVRTLPHIRYTATTPQRTYDAVAFPMLLAMSVVVSTVTIFFYSMAMTLPGKYALSLLYLY